MQVFKVKKQIEKKDQEDGVFIMKAPEPSDVETIYRGEDHLRVEDENGTMICTVLRKVMPKDLTAQYYDAIVNGGAITETTNRAAASGQHKTELVKKDGTISNYSKTEKPVQSSIVGFDSRNPRRNFCRMTAWTSTNPDKWTTVEKYTKKVDDLYKEFCPKEYEAHREFTKRTSPDFIIPETVFTSVTLNRNFRTFYHRDKGNLEDGYAGMTFMKTGKFSGGEICFPNYKIGVQLKNFDLIIMKNTEIHGNLPIKTVSKNSEYQRITCVFYYRTNMIYCGTAQEELERAKKNKGNNQLGSLTEDLNKGRW